MNFFKFIFSFSLITSLSYGQDWAWVKGPSSVDGLGVYGTQGVFAPANIPGARGDCAYWKDASGNIWLFGGSGFGSISFTKGRLNDIWKYDPVLNQWVWIKGPTTTNQFANYGTKGVSAPTNIPGSRYGSVTWVDTFGKFWMFGGYGVLTSGSPGYLNDLWKYDPVTNEWTWIGGPNVLNQIGMYGSIGVSSPTNIPGCRGSAVSWTDNSGDFWMFSGWGLGSQVGIGRLNDLWRYKVSTGEWTWMTGSTLTGVNGTYGVKGVGTSSTTPGTRDAATAWFDVSGNLWLFGGYGNAASSGGNLNDLWKYNIGTNQWTWVSGSNVSNQLGSYALLGMNLPTNNPGGRIGGVPVVDLSGNLWLFGGNGYAASGSTGFLNDLWRYNIASDQWTWFKGANLINQNGVYGTIGVSAPTNAPGSRLLSYAWLNSSGSFGLFGGGGGYGLTGGLGSLNDIWSYTICPATPSSPVSTSSVSNLVICSGTSTSITASGTGVINWFSSPSSTVILGSGNTFFTPTLTSNTTYYIDNVSCAYSNTRTVMTVTVNPLPLVSASSSNSLICTGQSLTVTASGASTYTWNPGGATGASVTMTPTVNTTYSVIGTSLAGCDNVAMVTVSVSTCTGIDKFESENFSVNVYPNPFTNQLKIIVAENCSLELIDLFGKKISELHLEKGETQIDLHELDSGIYLLKFGLQSNSFVKLVKVN